MSTTLVLEKHDDHETWNNNKHYKKGLKANAT